MSICYAISTGKYSDCEVCAIFTTRKKAEAALDAYGVGAEIEEFRLDPVIPELPAGQRLYRCFKSLASGQVHASSDNLSGLTLYDSSTLNYASYFEPHPAGKSSRVYVFARDREHAVKIAAEKFAKAEAIQAGIAQPTTTRRSLSGITPPTRYHCHERPATD